MPVLPLIDLLILLGWTSVMVGVALKAIWMSTVYLPTILGLSPRDFLLGGAVCLLFALTLAARTWVKLNEPRLFGAREGGGAHEGAGEETEPRHERPRGPVLAAPHDPTEARRPNSAARI